MPDVYITRISKFLPNESVSNDEMEKYLGLINKQASKSKKIILRNNGIKSRYYAITKEGKATHTNSEMASLAIKKLFDNNPDEIKDIDLLSCGTSSPDQMMPSHGVMVHGWLPETNNIEVVSLAGVCCSGMHAFKYAFMSVKLGEKTKAVSTGSERLSPILRSDQFEEEVQHLIELEEKPYLVFEKDFLRWMLSDGAGAFLMENKINPDGISLKVEWIEACSFANSKESCMYMAADKLPDGKLKSYKDFSPNEIISNSILSIKQDVKLLSENIVKLGFDKLKDILEEKNQNVEKIDYFLPHTSSCFFEDRIANILEINGIGIPKEKWFTNLRTKGNVGTGSIYLMLEELFNSGKLKKGQKILLAVPESSRFSYVFSLLTVC
ncbi:MAG: beta-ketoacyl-ACP synthase III [Bacteroidales bacterium]|nr:beta-ketoacyl-ACP synthase III [Bacteroidales bacterium]MCK4638577.1 beta-ketoacyl-ACP synthase III [Bacteroidales bacterium]